MSVFKQVHDLLLPGGGLVELAAHLDKPDVHLLLEVVHALFKPIEPAGGLIPRYSRPWA